MELVSFENNYVDTETQENDAIASVCIDGYPKDEDAEGTVVCEVFITKHGDIVTAWHHNGYRLNEYVLSLKKEAEDTLMGIFRGVDA